MLLTLEPLPAAEGDCLLLHWGTKNDPRIAVIDGGPGNIYENSLRPRLEEILDNRGLGQLPIELVMVSHVDNDHIVGIKKFFRRLKQEVEQSLPADQRPFVAKRLWHNTFNDILGDALDDYYKTLTASLQASVGGAPNPQLVNRLASEFQKTHGDSEERSREEALDIALVLAGHGEGRDLRDSHKFLHDAGQIAPLNSPFKKNGKFTLITAEMTPAPVKIAGLEFKIAGPLEAEIKALQKQFDAYIKKKGLAIEAVLAAYADKSIPNLSSILCLVEKGGKRILLTGDARGDKIISGLKMAGLLDGGTLSIDILKAPHHGSDRNVSPDFFETILADTYVFSGDGQHGNPDRTTLQWLTDARGKDAVYDVVLTYPVAGIDHNRKLDNDKKKNPKPWSHQQHSLDAFFKQKKQENFRFRLTAGAPVKIDLGDEKVTW